MSFEVGRGEVVGLLGPNGAGKTTLIRVLTGYFEPSAGRVTLDGIDVVRDPQGARQRIGYLPESTPLYPEMLVQEYLQMAAELQRVPASRATRLLAEAVWATGLEDYLTRPIGELSKGYRQRVGLAQAILHEPKVLILDEPTSGLDPSQVVQVRELIKRLSQSATVLFSTHILSEVEQVCERAIMVVGGKLRRDARLDELRASHRVILAFPEDASASGTTRSGQGGTVGVDELEALLGSIDGVEHVLPGDPREGRLRFELRGDDQESLSRAAFRMARDRELELLELTPVVEDLESVFRRLVREHAHDDRFERGAEGGAQARSEVSA